MASSPQYDLNNTEIDVKLQGPKTRISLHILRRVRVFAVQFAVAMNPKLLLENSEDFHQTKQIPRLGPVVQSVISLTSSLRVILLTVLADSIYNVLIFFAEKMWVAFALQKLLTFFQQKMSAYLRITRCKC